MRMPFFIASFVIGFVVVASPVFAQKPTENLQQILDHLLEQVAALQADLRVLQDKERTALPETVQNIKEGRTQIIFLALFGAA